jgi:hypothetical protein
MLRDYKQGALNVMSSYGSQNVLTGPGATSSRIWQLWEGWSYVVSLMVRGRLLHKQRIPHLLSVWAIGFCYVCHFLGVNGHDPNSPFSSRLGPYISIFYITTGTSKFLSHLQKNPKSEKIAWPLLKHYSYTWSTSKIILAQLRLFQVNPPEFNWHVGPTC